MKIEHSSFKKSKRREGLLRRADGGLGLGPWGAMALDPENPAMASDPENPALPTERALVISHGHCVLVLCP